jgi:DNA-binding protein YbaB
MTPVNPAEADPARLAEQLEQRIAEAKQKAEALAGMEGAGEGADGMVRVRVGPSGALKDLHLDPKAMRLPSMDLAAAIMDAAQAAQQDVGAQVRELYGASAQFGGLDPAGTAQGHLDAAAAIDERLQRVRDALRRAR